MNNEITMAWANMNEIKSPPFERIHDELYELEIKVPTYRHDCNHWGRRWEYPWAIINSNMVIGNKSLNAGSGTDVFGFYLSTIGPTIDLDIDPEVINEGRSKASNFPNLSFIVADMKEIPYPSNHFDKVFCISAMEHGKEPLKTYYYELMRVLRPGGTMILTVDIREGELKEETISELLGVKTPPKAAGILALIHENELNSPNAKYIFTLGIKILK